MFCFVLHFAAMAGFRSALLRAVPVRGAACRLGRWQPIRGAATGDKAPASKKPSYSDAKYGREHAKSESSAAAQMHAMGAGRYAYLQDFYKSLQRGRVKLDFNEKPPTARELAEEQAREKAVQIMGRSMALGGLLVLACFGVAWQMIKCDTFPPPRCASPRRAIAAPFPTLCSALSSPRRCCPETDGHLLLLRLHATWVGLMSGGLSAPRLFAGGTWACRA